MSGKPKTVIHAHHSPNPVSGEVKRIINICNDVAAPLADRVVEVEFYSLRSVRWVRTGGRFRLSDRVSRKFYVPNLERLGIVNDWWCSAVVAALLLRYRPAVWLEEWKLPRGIRRMVSLLSRDTRTILDLHGAAPEEFLYAHGRPNRALESQERRSVRAAGSIVCQSDEMKRHLVAKHGVDAGRVGVYRCGVDTTVFGFDPQKRKAVREQLGIAPDELLFVYSGGMHKWQRVADSLAMFREIHRRNPSTRMLVLTKDTAGLDRIIADNGLSDIADSLIVRSLPYDRVPEFLNAADAAFLLRDDDVMNRVASPTKLAEYMACGLPVLSSAVAECWVDSEGREFVFDVERIDPDALLAAVRATDKAAVAAYAARSLSLDVDRRRIGEFLGSL